MHAQALSVVVTNGPMLEQVDKQGTFKDSNFQKAMALASDSGSDPAAVKQQKKTDQGEDSDIYKLVRILAERNLDPVRYHPSLHTHVAPLKTVLPYACFLIQFRQSRCKAAG